MRLQRYSIALLALAFFVASMLLLPSEAVAQCALCKTAIQQGGGVAAKAMNLGILVLLIPPVAIFCTIFAVAYKNECERNDES